VRPASVAGEPDQPDDALELRAIRAALLPEEVADFDVEFRQVLPEATERLDPTPVTGFLRRWRRIAWSTTNDPAAHRRMLAVSADVQAGRSVPAEGWEQVKTRLGL
jgi:hypothetical protein